MRQRQERTQAQAARRAENQGNRKPSFCQRRTSCVNSGLSENVIRRADSVLRHVNGVGGGRGGRGRGRPVATRSEQEEREERDERDERSGDTNSSIVTHVRTVDRLGT